MMFNSRLCSIAVLLVGLLATTTPVQALTIPIEEGLAAAYPGEHPDFYNIVFVTGGTRAPIFTSNPGDNAIERAAWQVTYDAYLAGFVPGWDGVEIIWRPFMSMTGIAAVDHIDIAGPMFNTQGELVVTDSDTFFFGGADNLTNPIKYGPQGGEMLNGATVMSGTGNGVATHDDCGDWENSTGLYSSSSYTGTTLDANSGGACGQSGNIIAISPPIPWPQSQVAVPEPSTVVLSGIALLTLFGFAYRKMMLKYEV